MKQPRLIYPPPPLLALVLLIRQSEICPPAAKHPTDRNYTLYRLIFSLSRSNLPIWLISSSASLYLQPAVT